MGERKQRMKMSFKVLIACENSGVVRDAFIKRGFDAVSCDILPSENTGPHIQSDVVELLNTNQHFDLMIAHPPCTYLSASGIHWNTYKENRKYTIPPEERQLLTEQSLKFVEVLMNQNIKHIAIENPVGIISTRIRKPDQYIQPYFFGHPESKKTGLWLKNLPPLISTNILEKPEKGYWDNQTPSGQNKVSEKKDRWKERSKTYIGIADAMAEQWGNYISNHARI